MRDTKFDPSTAGLCRRAAGIREELSADSADRLAKEGGVPPHATAGGLMPPCTQASPRLHQQKTRPRLAPRTGSSVDAERLLTTPSWRRGSALSTKATGVLGHGWIDTSRH
jgi:hypothetical protein